VYEFGVNGMEELTVCSETLALKFIRQGITQKKEYNRL